MPALIRSRGRNSVGQADRGASLPRHHQPCRLIILPTYARILRVGPCNPGTASSARPAALHGIAALAVLNIRPMASVARARRTPQACDNCRRKKTRCPGEKPRCSTCARLRQECCYPRGEFQDGVQSPDIISRLSQLEEKLDLVLSRAPALADAPPPTADESQDTTVLPGDSPGWPEPAGSRLLPSRSLVSRGIDIYFLCSHRQPIWLFESPGDLSPDSREELILAVLAISVQYARDHLAGAGLLSPSVYSDAARSLIMLRIANASVDVATLQSLCLLSFSNLVSGQVQLASFHVGLVSSLMQCSGVDMHFTDERSPSLEQNRRLFWSVQAIRVLCGPPTKIPTTLDIEEPQFLSPDETSATITTGQAPLLPVEPRGSRNHLSLGIWAHLIRSASLWGLVRAYIWRCADGLAIAPWKSDSQYTAINSRLLEMECVFPTSYRYDAAKFSERSEEELNADRDFWLPWMKIQLTYHTLHSVLNHPFLYSSRESRPKQGPNAFWKTSTDQALLHSTWIARLINMASEKSFVLADPFFGYSASVAATLHLYWSRSADSRVQESAKGNLKICRALIAELGARWPICQTMVSSSSPRRSPLAFEDAAPVWLTRNMTRPKTWTGSSSSPPLETKGR